jgi:hypothetical protein
MIFAALQLLLQQLDPEDTTREVAGVGLTVLYFMSLAFPAFGFCRLSV